VKQAACNTQSNQKRSFTSAIR